MEMIELDERNHELLRVMLSEQPALLPFANAVVLHLTRSADAAFGPSVVAQVATVLTAAGGEGDALAVRTLSASPELLASFFQNADLLPTGTPEAAKIAGFVVSAIESIDSSGL
jgi:hypothetical protein